MKIAVYAIAKDEAEFASRFAESCQAADELVVLDTGSVDRTVPILEDHGARVHLAYISPWRFDVARNTALALVSAGMDVCIPLDLDEVLVEGWREAIEAVWSEETTRLSYGFVWSWLADGRPGVTFQQDKIHARTGYFWKHPVHEVITPDRRTEERLASTEETLLEHHPDSSKSRGQYLDLLKVAVAESPEDDRMMHYFGRELMYREEYPSAVVALTKHLEMPAATWAPERAASMRFISRCYAHMGVHDEAVQWARRACAEAPNTREPWVALALLLHGKRQWAECYAAATRALEIVERPPIYINEPDSWGAMPHDLASVSAYYLGLRREALIHAEIASEMEPEDDRIQANCRLIKERSLGVSGAAAVPD